MHELLIALSVLAGLIVLAVVIMLCASLISVHAVLGRRKTTLEVSESGVDLKYGTNYKWFEEVRPNSENFSITSFDGIKLSALLVKNRDNNKCVAICCHGYGVTYKSVQMQGQLFYDRGFDVLFPTMRGHGASEGKVGMGWIDRYDVMRWVDMIIEKYGKTVSIALIGVSMGGATVIGAAGMNPPSQVKCVIDDCGFSSHSDQYAVRLSTMGKGKAFLFKGFNTGLKLVHGYSVGDADFVPFAASMTVPALFIHGDADNVVPLELGKKLYDACGSAYKRLLTVHGAGHALAYAVDCRAYMSAVDEFIDKFFPGADKRSDALLPIEAERARLEEGRIKQEEEARLAAEKAEQDRLERERKEKEEKEEQLRLAAEREEKDRAENSSREQAENVENKELEVPIPESDGEQPAESAEEQERVSDNSEDEKKEDEAADSETAKSENRHVDDLSDD